MKGELDCSGVTYDANAYDLFGTPIWINNDGLQTCVSKNWEFCWVAGEARLGQNLAFLMNREDRWPLAPASDMTCRYHPAGVRAATHCGPFIPSDTAP